MTNLKIEEIEMQRQPFAQQVSVLDRIEDAREVCASYGMDVPVNLIDGTEEDGTAAGQAELALVNEVTRMVGEQVLVYMARLDSYRDALGAPDLTDAQQDLAIQFFGGIIRLRLGSLGLGIRKSCPDASSDLRRALFDGFLDPEDLDEMEAYLKDGE